MYDNYLSVISLDWLDFLNNDSRFSDFHYEIGIETGVDRDYYKTKTGETVDHGINIFTINYRKEDSQAREINEIALEYFESHNLDQNSTQYPSNIKERAKWFINWIDAGYSKTYVINHNGTCYETTIESINIIDNLGYVEDIDNSSNIKYVCILEVIKRNNYIIQLKDDYPNVQF
jgi:hypothetical protein